MKSSIVLVDANVMLRYLLDDVEEQACKAREIIESGFAYSYPEVLAEVVYVLARVYGCTRTEIGTALRALLENMSFYDREMLITAFNFFEYANIDFVDALLVARALVNNENVATFDKKLARMLGES